MFNNSIVEGNSWELLTLTLGLFYEISLGEKSYYYPWLRQVLDLDFSKTGFWNIKELKYLQNTKALEEIKKYEIAPIAFWKPFKKVL